VNIVHSKIPFIQIAWDQTVARSWNIPVFQTLPTLT